MAAKTESNTNLAPQESTRNQTHANSSSGSPLARWLMAQMQQVWPSGAAWVMRRRAQAPTPSQQLDHHLRDLDRPTGGGQTRPNAHLGT